MKFHEAQDRISAFPKGDPDAAFRAGIELLRGDYPELLLPVARSAARRTGTNARLHQLVGLAARATGETAIALDAFREAARILPNDPLIAHSLARVTLEAGLSATALFDRASTLAPNDGSVLQGHAAAMFHEGDTEGAIALLTQVLDANPLWTDGHRDLAHLRGQMGQEPMTSIDSALARMPASPDLHRLRISVALEARNLPQAQGAVANAMTQLTDASWLEPLAGHVASECGDFTAAESHFGRMGTADPVNNASLLARHLLRAGKPDQAASVLEPVIRHDREHMLWPYLSLAWRLTNDPRWDWLEGDASLTGTYDIDLSQAELATLADHLRGLHVSKEAPLDQSVRGGTQTDGNLLLRIDPPIRKLRKALLKAVERHVKQLPPPQAGHPTLLASRAPLRIAGSWSVRLRDAGFHTDHVHGMGWFSSALYLALPPGVGPSAEAPASNEQAGWLSLGESREILPDLPPMRMVQPAVGRLALFPSTMWHGTRPFPTGERMTVAFDIARPRQEQA